MKRHVNSIKSFFFWGGGTFFRVFSQKLYKSSSFIHVKSQYTFFYDYTLFITHIFNIL